MTKEKIKTTGQMLPDGTIIEMVLNSEKNKTELIVKDGDKIVNCDKFQAGDKIYLPYGENNNLIKNNIILLPSKASEYESSKDLVSDIQKFINKYVDLDPLFEKLCSYYILLSWVYDGFNQLPYFRKSGDFGTGKTRFLTVIGSLCYKPIFASGSSSTAALFHILDTFRGTLVLDEADFRYSDEKAELTKVLNNGFTKGYPVLRCAFNKNKEFDPVGYQVYGCKILASRKHFSDPALESRFISEKPRFSIIRSDIPIELPELFNKETLALRNQLLTYRFNMLEPILKCRTNHVIEGAEPRINQIFSPLLQLINDDEDELINDIKQLALEYSRQIQKGRSETIEFHVLSAIKFLSKNREKVTIGDITNYVMMQYSDFYDRKVTAKWIGYVVSKSLCIKTQKVGGFFSISPNQEKYLNTLYARYSV